MTKEEERKLRAYHYSLAGQVDIFRRAAESMYGDTRASTVQVLTSELSKVKADFPGLLPEFDESQYFKEDLGGHASYYAEGIWSYLIAAVARLKSMLDEVSSVPVTEEREFSFVKDPDLRRILERDYREIQRVYVVEGWKSVMILAGGAIEAILADVLSNDASAAKSATKAPKKADIRDWDLIDLINVAAELGIVTTGVEKLSHSLREYRNLVHPGNEIRRKLLVEREEAKIALEILNMVYRDLSAHS